MRIAHVSGLGQAWGPYPPDILTRTDATVGGGEAALLHTAFGLASNGHAVTAYIPLQGPPTTYQGVHFRPLKDAYLDIAVGEFDAVISWSDALALHMCPPGARRVFSQQLNDMPGAGAFWESVDVIASPSMTHANFLAGHAPRGVKGHYRFVIMPSGVDPTRYAAQRPYRERGHVVSYWSSPDRGLHHLLLIWPEIRKRVPDAELRIFYHLDRFIESALPHSGYDEINWRAVMLDQLVQRRMEGVRVVGAIARPVLARHQMETKVWTFPFDPINFTEGFCVSAAEAIAAGCWPIVRPADALEELWDPAVQWVGSEDDAADADFRAEFADAVVNALLANENPYADVGRELIKQYTWEAATEALEGALR